MRVGQASGRADGATGTEERAARTAEQLRDLAQDSGAAELAAVMEFLPVGVYLGDASGVTACNRYGRELIGMHPKGDKEAPSDPVPSHIRDAFARLSFRDPDTGCLIARENDLITRALAYGETGVREMAYLHPITRERVIVRAATAPIRAAGGYGEIVGFVAVHTDITDYRRALEQRDQALAERDSLLTRERRVVETLQRSLITAPPERPIPGVSVAAVYEAASYEAEVGGDFYSVFPLDRWRVALIVGDQNGKGIGAAARTARLKYALQAYLSENPDPAVALTRINRLLNHIQQFGSSEGIARSDGEGDGDNDPADMTRLLACVSIAVLDGRTGDLTCAAAGMDPPLIVRASPVGESAATSIETESVEDALGPMLGILPDFAYSSGVCRRLEPGDLVVMTTDGVTEARDPLRRFFGYAGFVRSAREAAVSGGNRPAFVVDAVFRSVREFARGGGDDIHATAETTESMGRLHDDVCVLAARYENEE